MAADEKDSVNECESADPSTASRKRRVDDEVRERMIRFVKTHYAETLGKDIELLDQPGGLELLHQKYCGPKQ